MRTIYRCYIVRIALHTCVHMQCICIAFSLIYIDMSSARRLLDLYSRLSTSWRLQFLVSLILYILQKQLCKLGRITGCKAGDWTICKSDRYYMRCVVVNRVLVHCSARYITSRKIVCVWMRGLACIPAYYQRVTHFSFSSLCTLCPSLLSNPSVTSASRTNDCTNFLSPGTWRLFWTTWRRRIVFS